MKLKDPLMDKFREQRRGSEGDISDSHGAPNGGVNDPVIVSFWGWIKAAKTEETQTQKHTCRQDRQENWDETGKQTSQRDGANYRS